MTVIWNGHHSFSEQVMRHRVGGQCITPYMWFKQSKSDTLYGRNCLTLGLSVTFGPTSGKRTC